MKGSSLEVSRVEDIERVEELKEDWNRLLQSNETKTTELTYEWQMTYWKYFNDGASLFILVVKDGDAVVGIAPLKLSQVRKSGLPVRSLEFIAAEQSNYQDFIVDSKREEVFGAILDYLVSTSRHWDVLKLSHVPEASPTTHFFLSKLDGRLVHRDQKQACLVLNLDTHWKAYASQSKKARKQMARNLRKLQEAVDCEVAYFACAGEAQFSSKLLKFFDLHRAQWNQTSTPSQFNDERYRQFYLDVSSRLLPKGQVDLFVLEAAGQPVAFNYAFLFEGTRIGQLSAYDTNFSKYAPGLVMLELLVKDSFADGRIRMLDFGDYYSYKEYWTESLKYKQNVQIYPRRPWPIFIYLLAGMYKRLRTRLDRHPRLMERVEQLRRRFAS